MLGSGPGACGRGAGGSGGAAVGRVRGPGSAGVQGGRGLRGVALRPGSRLPRGVSEVGVGGAEKRPQERTGRALGLVG